MGEEISAGDAVARSRTPSARKVRYRDVAAYELTEASPSVDYEVARTLDGAACHVGLGGVVSEALKELVKIWDRISKGIPSFVPNLKTGSLLIVTKKRREHGSTNAGSADNRESKRHKWLLMLTLRYAALGVLLWGCLPFLVPCRSSTKKRRIPEAQFCAFDRRNRSVACQGFQVALGSQNLHCRGSMACMDGDLCGVGAPTRHCPPQQIFDVTDDLVQPQRTP